MKILPAVCKICRYLSRQKTLNLVDHDLACKRKFLNHEVIDKCARVFGNYSIQLGRYSKFLNLFNQSFNVGYKFSLKNVFVSKFLRDEEFRTFSVFF